MNGLPAATASRDVKGRAARSRLAAVVLLALAFTAAPAADRASAQSLSFAGDGSDAPIEIYAEDGIEWQQDTLMFLARGKARAVRGNVTVYADVLRAYYRKTKSGGTDIWRLDAEGHVKIASPEETAYGDRAVYDVDNAVLVLSGGKPRLEAGADLISADKQLEYWEKKRMAVARGNALAVRQDKKLKADVIAAYFRTDKQGKNELYRVEAFDRVNIMTGKDRAEADRGIYNVKSGIATLTGSVRIRRGPNVLRGCSAEVNLNTGVSKLFACKGGSAGRVKGTIMPRAVKKK